MARKMQEMLESHRRMCGPVAALPEYEPDRSSLAAECPDITQRYLQATARTLVEAAKEQGYVLHYIVDNVFDEFGRLLLVYPVWFGACGLKFLCPHGSALELMQVEKADISYAEYKTNLPKFVAAAHDAASQAVHRCDQDSVPYVFLGC
ncbi:MAG: hypothetical protein JO352_30610 [Chloroflexi bacterium]|nr:hypothetical protein [Chloroflexota bacterium]MBV9596137.1 hypothetical protein [Chloroflexota bacterium]